MRALAFLICRVFYAEPVSTSTENALRTRNFSNQELPRDHSTRAPKNLPDRAHRGNAADVHAAARRRKCGDEFRVRIRSAGGLLRIARRDSGAFAERLLHGRN